MKLIIFTAVLVAARGATLLGQDKCTWGPSYWCSSLEAASQCQTFTHCVDTAWKNKVLAVHQTEVCLLAQKVVDSVRHVLPDDDGKEQASHLLSSMCPLVRDDVMRKKCKVMVTEYFPEMVGIIDAKIDSISVSTVLGFCQPGLDSDIDNQIPQAGPYYPPTNSTMCEDCKAFVGDLGNSLNQPGAEQKFVTVMSNIICPELGDLADLCKAFLELELPKVFKYLAKNDNPEMACRLGTFCINTVDDGKPKLENEYDSLMGTVRQSFSYLIPVLEKVVTCHECRKMLAPVLALEKDSRFRVAVEHAVGYLCSETKIGEDKCNLLAAGFIPNELSDMLSHDYEASQICTSTLRCIPDTEIGSALHKMTQFPVELNVVDEPQTASCSDCLRFFDDVRTVLRDNVTAIEAAAMAKQSLCQNVGPLEYECNDLMDVFMPVILQYLSSVDSPQKVCGDLTVCAQSPAVAKFDIVKYFNQAWQSKHLGDFKCDECQKLVQDAREEDRSAEFQKPIVDFFNNICGKLGKEANQCKGLVQQYAPQLFEILASELEPEVLCELLLRCSKPEIQEHEAVFQVPQKAANTVTDQTPVVQTLKKSKKNSAAYSKKDEGEKDVFAKIPRTESEKEQTMGVLEQLKVRAGESVECAICRLVMESIDDVIAANATQQEVENGLKEVCKVLPSSVREPCDEFINTYTPALVDLLLQELDPFLICNELRVCNDSGTQLAPILRIAEELQSELKNDLKDGKAVKDTVECQLCELIVGSVDSFIGSNRSEATIKKALDDICKSFPLGMRNQCRSFVDEYSVVVVQLLLQELDPQQVCIFLGICKPKMTASVASVDKTPLEEAGPLCSLCEIVINEVDLIIGDNKSEPAIQAALDKVCAIFPITIRDECISFVNTYAPAIINLLIQELKPQAICKALGLCQSAEEVALPAALPNPTESGPLCDLCEAVLTQLDALLGSNKTEAAVEYALNQVCTFFPPNMSATCASIINEYAPAIINLLVQEVRPKDVCKHLGLCASARVAIDLPEVPNKEDAKPDEEGDDVYCKVCKLIIAEINNIVKENRSEAALIHAVEKVCSLLSGDLKLQCQSEVENYGPAVLDLLTHMNDPDKICKAIKLCLSPNNSENKRTEITITPGEECIICQTLANYAYEALNEQATANEVVKLLTDVCTKLPDSIHEMCNRIVEQFTPVVLQQLADKINPLQLCQEIDLCPKNVALRPNAVGVDPCSYGPAYWCANMQNAKQCQVVKDCVEKYGMKP